MVAAGPGSEVTESGEQCNGPPSSAAQDCSDSEEEEQEGGALLYWESKNLGERALLGLEELEEAHEWGRQRLNRQLAICDRKYKEVGQHIFF